MISQVTKRLGSNSHAKANRPSEPQTNREALVKQGAKWSKGIKGKRKKKEQQKLKRM